MALLKIVQVGDEIVFKVPKGGDQRISIKFSEKSGRAIALVIKADRSIPVEHVRAGSVDMEDQESVEKFINS